MNAVARSLRVTEIAFTGYPVTNMARAREFYENVLGLKTSVAFEQDGREWIEYDIGPGTLALSNMTPEWRASGDGPAVALEVEDFDAAIAVLREAGTTFALEPTASPACRLAVVTDPDGNGIAIHRRNR